MKGFAFLLFALVAVQARHTGVQQSTRAAAALGENPWFVHLRIATSTSGLLETCAGTLIANSWLLTTASCVSTSRFIWARYGVVNVVNPSLFTESREVRINPDYDAATGNNNLALLNIGRNVEPTENYRPVRLADVNSEVPSSATYCGFGAEEDKPGSQLNCFDLAVEAQEDGGLTATSDEVKTTRFDLGAPLVSDGVQYGILTASATEGSIGTFEPVSKYLDWISSETGINFNPDDSSEIVPEVAPDTVRIVK